jgi:hypothetical protein
MAQKIHIAELQAGGERLELQYLPTEVNFTREASIANIEVAGRNDPIAQWTGGSTKLNFSFTFYSNEEGRQDVLRKVNWLKSLTYKDRNGVVSAIRLIYGNMFRDYVWLMQSVQVKYDVISSHHKAPFRAEVSISLVAETADREFTKEDIRSFVS